MAAKTNSRAARPQNNKKPVNAGLCNFKNCRKSAYLLSERDLCYDHMMLAEGLAKDVQVAKKRLVQKFSGIVGWLRGGK